MSVEELYNSGQISVRSFNVCKDNKLVNLTLILEHFLYYNTFDDLRNCGRKSNAQLTDLCLKYLNNQNNDTVVAEKAEKYPISNFTRTQREIVNSFIEINATNLSNRGRNAIMMYLNSDLKIKNIGDKILNNYKFDFNELKNIGIKTAAELRYFIDLIIDFVEKISEVKHEHDLILFKNKFFIEKTFSVTTIPFQILEKRSIFLLVDYIISNNFMFDKNVKTNTIFKKTFNIYINKQEATLSNVAAELNISKERVRQIRTNCMDDLLISLQFIKNIDDDLYQKYGIDINQDFIRIDEDINENINSISATCFSREFTSLIIYSYLSHKFDLIGNKEDILLPKQFNARKRHNWSNFYLISKSLNSEFDFNELADDIFNRLNTDRIEETYSFNFKSYLMNFFKSKNIIEDFSLVSKISKIAEKILNIEFSLIIDLEDNIVFKRNTIKQVHEYAIEVLEKIGIPSKINEIFEQIVSDYPEVTKSPQALRGNLQRTPEIIYFGRSSTYGLKKWELEKEGIKGGTIKHLIYNYLKDSNKPIHVYEIYK